VNSAFNLELTRNVACQSSIVEHYRRELKDTQTAVRRACSSGGHVPAGRSRLRDLQRAQLARSLAAQQWQALRVQADLNKVVQGSGGAGSVASQWCHCGHHRVTLLHEVAAALASAQAQMTTFFFEISIQAPPCTGWGFPLPLHVI